MSNEQNIEQFAANAAAYVSSEVHAKGASLARLVELVQPQGGWRVLDIATGAGHTALVFAPHVAKVTAADITPQMLEQAQKLAAERGAVNVVFETADAADLPFTDGSFDLVTCRIAAHHFPDTGRFISEAARVLRRGGVFALVDNVVPPGMTGDYVNAFEKLRDPSHNKCLNLEQWRSEIEAARLAIRHQETMAKTMNFAFWAQRHDAVMKSYLQSLLLECGPAPAAFLQPRATGDDLTFRLLEGVFTAEKAG